MSYSVPSLLISQEFNQVPAFTASPLPALIIGPTYLTGSITAVALGTAGSGYVAPPTITVTDTTGVDAVITAVLANLNGAILTVAVATQGSGYANSPSAPPTITISDATGVRAQLLAVVVGGAVTSITVVNGGYGYSSSPTITIAAPGSGTTAVAGAITRGTGA